MTKEKTYYIYKHTNPFNQKCYIGKTCLKPNTRWGFKGSGYKNQPKFYEDIVKYGWENFTHEILCDGLTNEEAQIKEIEMIHKYNSLDPEHGYNTNCGDVSGYKNYYIKKKEERLVHCIELNLTFKTASEAERATGIDNSAISKVCKGLRASAGKHPQTGEKLHWEYIKE